MNPVPVAAAILRIYRYGYCRFGGVRGTACLPAALLPIAAMEYVLGTGWFGLAPEPSWAGSFDPPVAAALLLGVAVAGLGPLAGRVLVHSAPIPAKRS